MNTTIHGVGRSFTMLAELLLGAPLTHRRHHDRFPVAAGTPAEPARASKGLGVTISSSAHAAAGLILAGLASTLPLAMAGERGASVSHPFVLGRPKHLTVEYGQVVYGAEAPRAAHVVSGLNFSICGTRPRGADTIVYGIRRGRGIPPQVWRATTRDGIVFTNALQLFEAPPVSNAWAHADLALKDDTLVMLICGIGVPWYQGHPLPITSDRRQGRLQFQLVDFVGLDEVADRS